MIKTLRSILPVLILGVGISLPAQDTINRLDRAGRKTGYWIRLDSSGNKEYEGSFHEGHPVGRFIRFHPDGRTKYDMLYDSSGRHVKARLYDTGGKLRAEGEYLDQKKEGLWNFFSGKEIILYRIHYHSGLVNGEAWRYDPEGRPLEKTLWANSIPEGERTVFHPDGKPQVRMNYTSGNLNGTYEMFHPDGSPEVTGHYRDNLKDGPWTYYHPGGKADYVLMYDRGKLLNPEILDQRRRETFDRYERNRLNLRDPQEYINNPEELLIR